MLFVKKQGNVHYTSLIEYLESISIFQNILQKLQNEKSVCKYSVNADALIPMSVELSATNIL